MDYMEEWGKNQSPARLEKMANSIAAFARNFLRRRNQKNYDTAIREWIDDLAWLSRNTMIKWLGLLHGPKSNEWRAIMSILEIISQDKIKIQEETSEYSYSVICQLKANGEVGVCEIRGMGWLMLLEELIPIYDEARKYFGRSVLNPLQKVLEEWFETEITVISIANFDNLPGYTPIERSKEMVGRG